MTMNVHNELEAIVLIKESFAYGKEEKFFDCEFFTHDGKYLFKTYTYFTDFKILYQDGKEKVISI
jgi:hypothetical protein